MIASLTLAALLAATPDGPGFRIAVSGDAGSPVELRAVTPRGWLAAFCSARVCAVGHVHVRIPSGGTAYVDLHLHNVNRGEHGETRVTAGGRSIALPTPR